MKEETNKNNLKIGDEIMVEQAWEDEAGNYHDEVAEIKDMDDKGELKLDFIYAPDAVRISLTESDGYMANDYKKEN